MSYKKVDKIFENWRRSTYSLPPISNHFAEKQQLNENWRDKLFQLATAASLILGTAVTFDYLKDLEAQSKERIEQMDKVDLDSMEPAERYHYLLKKEVEKKIQENPNLVKKFTDPESEMYSVYKDGQYKGQVDRVAAMHKYVKKYNQDLNMTDNGNYVYVEPGAIEPDDVLPMLGITAEQYKTILTSDKNFMELTRVAMGNPDSWVYGKQAGRQFASIEYEGQYKNVLPLDWSIAMDMATVKGQQFMEEVASEAFEEDPKTGFKVLNMEKFNEVKKKYGIYNQSDYQKAMWNLNDFVRTDSHSVWDQIEDFAGVHRAQPGYDPSLLRGYDVDPDTLPLESSLQAPSNPDDMPENPIHIYVNAPSNIKENISKRRKVCIKILKS
tara:strand:+ start:1505 stop:2653 length:1149 start_codon:yes stop_codon:yes gene_type:complete